MTIELIGFITFGVGLLILRFGADFGIYVLVVATLLGAAAALKLPALAGANILPAHALLLFYLIAVARLPGDIERAFNSIANPGPGFWLAAFVAYGLLSALFLPRLFAGSIEVFSIARDSTGHGGVFTRPLSPGSGNVTQPLYLAGDLAVFAAVVAHASSRGLATIARAVLVAAGANLMFAAADLITYNLSVPEVMDFIHNANYGMLVEAEIQGVKRIVGSFSEASAFGGVTLGYFAFCFELWLRGVYPRVTGTLATLSMLAVLGSTSSAAYVGFGIYAVFILFRCAIGIAAGATTRRAAVVTFAVPAVTLLIVLAWAMIPSAWTSLSDLIDRTLLNKLHTQSGIERSLWNEHALNAFFESSGWGVGVGSVRASSFFVSVLANTGFIGASLLSVFLASLMVVAARGSPDRRDEAFMAAGGWTCFAVIVSAGLVASGVDLGLLFFINAAIVVSGAQRSRRVRSTQSAQAPLAAPMKGEGFARLSPMATAAVGSSRGPRLNGASKDSWRWTR